MIDKKIKELKEANLGNIVDVLVDIIKYQDDRISELEKSKYDNVCPIPKFTLEGNTTPINNTITKDEFIQNVQCNSVDVEIQDYNNIVITKDFIISEITKTFKEITETIMNSESMTDISFHYYNFLINTVHVMKDID